jgi:hypothetical protein
MSLEEVLVYRDAERGQIQKAGVLFEHKTHWKDGVNLDWTMDMCGAYLN